MFGFSPFSAAPVAEAPVAAAPVAEAPVAAFSVFSFSPFAFFGGSYAASLAPETKVRMADGSLIQAQDVQVGDELLSVDILGLANTDRASIGSWSGDGNLSLSPNAITTVTSLSTRPNTTSININGDIFTETHLILIKRDGIEQFALASNILETDLAWNYNTSSFTAVESYSVSDSEFVSITINCEPLDIYFTEHHITHDGIN